MYKEELLKKEVEDYKESMEISDIELTKTLLESIEEIAHYIGDKDEYYMKHIHLALARIYLNYIEGEGSIDYTGPAVDYNYKGKYESKFIANIIIMSSLWKELLKYRNIIGDEEFIKVIKEYEVIDFYSFKSYVGWILMDKEKEIEELEVNIKEYKILPTNIEQFIK